jgi:TRAP-type C4-dicarboxylate transport system substrate-binding protein
MDILKRSARTAGLGLAALALGGFAAAAQELPRHHFKALIHDSGTPHVDQVESPFWHKWIPEASGGRITADAVPLDQAGIPDEAVLRLLKLGAFDFASFDIVKLGGDDPRFEGCDLSGLAFDFDTARAACQAWRPTIDRIMQEQWNTKLLGIASAPPMAIWCNTEIGGIDDLKGKKLRVFSKTMIDFAEGIGAVPININFREVVTALQNKVVDCAVTGTSVGNVSGWAEVTQYLMPISLGWAINVHVVNLKTWNRLEPQVQQWLIGEFGKFEDKFWATMKANADDAENCNVGREPCKLGKLANMKLVTLSDAEVARFKALMQESVLKAWVKRAGADAAKEWNATVGKVLGMEAGM